MIKLSDRMMAITSEISVGETMADIGTDHGFLPLSLWEQGTCKKVIMTDVSPESLQKAVDNCSGLYPNQDFDFRPGDGLSVLEPGEVDTLVIAGMGGVLIAKLLAKDVEKTKTYKKLILQPRRGLGPLRHWLYFNGFQIIKEQYVREGKFICEILTVIPGQDKGEGLPLDKDKDAIEWEINSSLKNTTDQLEKEYLEKKLNREGKILRAKNLSNRADKEVTLHNMKYINSLLTP